MNCDPSPNMDQNTPVGQELMNEQDILGGTISDASMSAPLDSSPPNILAFFNSQHLEGAKFYFKEDLPIRSSSTQSVVGHCTVNLTEGLFRGDVPCHSLTISSHYQPAPAITCKRSLTSLISKDLETLMQSIYEVWDIQGSALEELGQEFVLDDMDGKMVVTETRGEKEEVTLTVDRETARGIVSEGLHWLLMRIISQMDNVRISPLTFYTYGPKTLRRTTYQFTSTGDTILVTLEPESPTASPNPTSSIDSLHSDFTDNERVHVESQKQQSMDSLRYLSDPCVPKELGYTSAGTCLFVRPKDSDIGIESGIPVSIQAEAALQQDPFAMPDFGGSLELQSEFIQRKREVKSSHEHYISQHPELGALMADYIQLVLHRKPVDVYGFTKEYFLI